MTCFPNKLSISSKTQCLLATFCTFVILAPLFEGCFVNTSLWPSWTILKIKSSNVIYIHSVVRKDPTAYFSWFLQVEPSLLLIRHNPERSCLKLWVEHLKETFELKHRPFSRVVFSAANVPFFAKDVLLALRYSPTYLSLFFLQNWGLGMNHPSALHLSGAACL